MQFYDELNFDFRFLAVPAPADQRGWLRIHLLHNSRREKKEEVEKESEGEGKTRENEDINRYSKTSITANVAREGGGGWSRTQCEYQHDYQRQGQQK